MLPSLAIRQKPRLVVSRKSPVAGSMSSVLTNGGFFEKSTSRGEGAFAGAAGGAVLAAAAARREDEGEQRGARGS